jgi:hypothetical protein
VSEVAAILVAARDEEGRIGRTVEALRAAFPGAEVIVADDGSRDGTIGEAEAAGARILELPRRGKGQALTVAERLAPPGTLLLADADLAGDLRPLLQHEDDLVVGAFATRRGGGFGIATGLARQVIRVRTGFVACAPLSGQRLLRPRARAAAFPVAPGFGVETRMTIDVLHAAGTVHERVLPLEHRPTGRDLRGFVHRGRQLVDALLACGPSAVNHRGLRLPIVGWMFALRGPWPVRAIAVLGLADDVWSGDARGFRGHVRAVRSTGTLKLVGIPLVSLAATRSLRAAALVSLSANFLNQLDTRPGRALKAFVAASALARAPRAYVAAAVLLAPYDLREMTMLGDAGSNALGAVLGFGSVTRSRGRRQWLELGALATLTILGETRSIGAILERTPVLRELDSLGRQS